MYTTRLTNVLHESEEDWEPVKPRVNKDGTLEKIPLHKQYVKSGVRVARERAAASRHASMQRRDASNARREAAKNLATSDAIFAAYIANASPYKNTKSDGNRPYLKKNEVVKVIKVKVPGVKQFDNKCVSSVEERETGLTDSIVGSTASALVAAAPGSDACRPADSLPPPRLEGAEVAEARTSAANSSNDSTLSKVALRYVEGVVHTITNDVLPSTSPFNNVIII
jgi:hypothetical protein